MMGGVERLLKRLVTPFRRMAGGGNTEAEGAAGEARPDQELSSEENEMADNAETQVEVVVEESQADAPADKQDAPAEVVKDTAPAPADPAPAPRPEATPAPDAPAPVVQADTAPAPVAEQPEAGEVTEAFADLYAASSQAFANSRAMKAQKEMELETLEKALPDAERAKADVIKAGNEAMAQAQADAANKRQEAESEVVRIKDAITAKQVEIEKAEASDVEKAEALVAILSSYITKHAG